MKQMKYFIPAFLFLALFSACSKEDDEPTTAELLASGTWKFDEGGVDNNQDGMVDLIISVGLLDPCTADNTITFSTNGTGVIDEGATKCMPSASQSTNFNYSLSNNDTEITLSGADLLDLGGNFEITEVSSTRLGLSKDTTLAPFPMPVSLIVYLKH
jgi:hypothetical protein